MDYKFKYYLKPSDDSEISDRKEAEKICDKINDFLYKSEVKGTVYNRPFHVWCKETSSSYSKHFTTGYRIGINLGLDRINGGYYITITDGSEFSEKQRLSPPFIYRTLQAIMENQQLQIARIEKKEAGSYLEKEISIVEHNELMQSLIQEETDLKRQAEKVANKRDTINAIKIITLIVMVIAFIVAIASSSSSSSGGSSSSSATCGYCGRTYYDSSNIHSIHRTHLCNSCNTNRQNANKALNK